MNDDAGATMASTATPLAPADQALVDAIAAGPHDARRRAVAKAITLLESTRGEHRRRADALFAALPVPPQPALRIGISTLAAGHKTLVPAVIEALKAQGASDIVVFVGGVIPRGDYDFLYDAGVKGIYGPGTPIPASAKDVLEQIRRSLATA